MSKAFMRLLAPLVAFALLSVPIHAAPASALGPEVVLAEAAGGFIGRLSTSPDHGGVDTPVIVHGEGLPASEELDLVWRTVKGSWKVEDGKYHGRDFAPVAYRIATVTTDAEGSFSASFVTPEDFGFQHDIVVQQGDRLLTQTGYNVDLVMKITPEARLGQPVNVDVTGIGWRNYENSWLLVYDNSFTGWVSAVTTSGSAHFIIPATGAQGVHVLRLVHGAFTFPYLNPEQNPFPGRAQPSAEFRLIAGDPVLPPAPEQQIKTSIRGLSDAVAELSVSPLFAGIGEPVTVQAPNLVPGQTYQLEWTTVKGNRVAKGGWDLQSGIVAEAMADPKGNAVFLFDVPDDLGGSHELRLADGQSTRIASFWITPTALPLDVQSGPSGTIFTVHLKGVGWTETANIYNVNYDNAHLGYVCAFNSQGDVTIHLPASGEPGWHFIDLYPGIYKGVEDQPNNFLIPQLTYAEDHPGEDLPAFHFSFYVGEGGDVFSLGMERPDSG